MGYIMRFMVERLVSLLEKNLSFGPNFSVATRAPPLAFLQL